MSKSLAEGSRIYDLCLTDLLTGSLTLFSLIDSVADAITGLSLAEWLLS